MRNSNLRGSLCLRVGFGQRFYTKWHPTDSTLTPAGYPNPTPLPFHSSPAVVSSSHGAYLLYCLHCAESDSLLIRRFVNGLSPTAHKDQTKNLRHPHTLRVSCESCLLYCCVKGIKRSKCFIIINFKGERERGLGHKTRTQNGNQSGADNSAASFIGSHKRSQKEWES